MSESLPLSAEQERLASLLIEHIAYARQCLDPLRPLELNTALLDAEKGNYPLDGGRAGDSR